MQIRATQLIDAPEGAVRRAFRSPQLWIRTGAAAGLEVEIARGAAGLGRLEHEDLLSVRAAPGGGRRWTGRRLLLRVELPDTSAAVRVPALRRVAGPLRRCEITLATSVADGGGTLATVTCEAQAGPATPGPLLQRSVRPVLQLLLGIATLVAREPQVVVAAAIVRGGRILAARRPPDRVGATFWELPGGKVEPGESDTDALRRELSEELGIAATIGGRLGPELDLGDNRLLRCHLAALDGGEPAPHEHVELRWLAADELDAVPWLPADLDLLAPLRRALTAGT